MTQRVHRDRRPHGSHALRSLAVLLTLAAILAPAAWITLTNGHGPAATGTAVLLTAGRASSDLRPASMTGAGNSSCPTSGPLGGLNTTWVVAVLVVTALAGLGVGIGLGRWTAPRRVPEPPDPALNPQPLPPGMYAPGEGPGSGTGKGGKTSTPDLNPQPLPPGDHVPPGGSSGGNRT